MTVRRYRKKPVVIEAIRWDGTPESATEVIDWVLSEGGTARYHEAKLDQEATVRNHEATVLSPAFIVIDALEESTIHASAGDFVIRGVHGEFYPCKPDIFEETYETVEESNDE